MHLRLPFNESTPSQVVTSLILGAHSGQWLRSHFYLEPLCVPLTYFQKSFYILFILFLKKIYVFQEIPWAWKNVTSM